MLQLLMAAAFSAAPLTLYVPLVRSLSLFVEAMEVVCRDCGPYSHDVVAHFRVGLSRVLAGLAQPISGRLRWIDLKATRLRYPNLSSYRRVHTVGFQDGTWILLNFLPMEMSGEGQIQGAAKSNEVDISEWCQSSK
ncbi:hypothetical protein Zm00014a_002700 [Zea mays]|uniref:Uncharacterized protein n=1 Tax=Zea mays TaxID=4577 RepID=A0A317YEW2_MAIZE|nr:hypothetical protein Zm00014a_002700 [Zea mays]